MNKTNALSVIDEATRDVAQQIKSVLGFEGNDGDLALFATVSRRLGLDPFARQIYAVFRGGRMVIQTGIDGYRAIAYRTGQLEAIGEPVFGPIVNGHPEYAKIEVWRKGSARPTVGVAYWEEYVQQSNGKPMGLWARMPRTMLAKCAESQALRKSFPEALSGVYTAEEMSQADSQPSLAPAPAQVVEIVPLAPEPAPAVVEPEVLLASDMQIQAIIGITDKLAELGVAQASVAAIERKAGKPLRSFDEMEADRLLNQLLARLEKTTDAITQADDGSGEVVAA